MSLLLIVFDNDESYSERKKILQNQNSVSEHLKFRYEAPIWFNNNSVRIIDSRWLVITYNSRCQKVTSSNKGKCPGHFIRIINHNAPYIQGVVEK
jgi:hypothetical protein